MIDILNSKPGNELIHTIAGSINNSFFNIEFSELNEENKIIVNNFFDTLPKNVGVIILDYPLEIEVKYFNNDIIFIEGVEEISYLTTEYSEIIDSFVELINTYIII